MKSHIHEYVEFSCDSCGATAAIDKAEAEALKKAREVAEVLKWRWHHPGWGLTCPQCMERERLRA